MNKRAYLRSNEGIFPLSPKITIIGRESCDFVIQNITVDGQQAVIEYFDGEDCFILKDLNSTHGTYVNDCRIQNASVRLAEGDVLKFGFSAGLYEFHSEDLVEGDADVTTTYTQIPVGHKQSWQPNMMQTQQPSTSAQITTLPVINYSHPPPIQQRHTVSGFGPWAQLPRAPSSNPRLGRPQSANGPNRRQIIPTAPQGSSSSSSTFRRGSVSGPIRPFLPDHGPQPIEDVNIMDMQNEIERLRYVENHCHEKTMQIDNLAKQNSELLHSRGKSISEEVYNQIKDLTDEVSRKCNDVERLQRLVERLSDSSSRHNSNVSNNDSDMGILRHEIEKMKKDLQISYGLVTSLQKDLSNRDEAMKKLNNDIEHLNHEIAEKDISVSALMNKLSHMKDVQEEIQSGESEKQDRERELIGLKHKLRAAESSNQEKEEQLGPLKKFIEELHQSEKINLDTIRDITLKLEESKTMLGELQRSDSLLRVDATKSENKYEQFRSKVLYVALSTPGYKSDNNALKDDELIDIMKELVKDKVEHDHRMCEKQKLFEAEVHKHEQVLNAIDQFNMKLKEASEMLCSGERTSNKIQKLVTAITTFPSIDCIHPLRDVIVMNLTNEMEFLTRLESCISDAGPELANLSLSDCFKRIIERSLEAVECKARTANQLSEAVESHEEEMRRLKREYEEEMLAKISQAVDHESSRNEEDRRLALEEITDSEQKKLERVSKECEEKLKEYEENIATLQNMIRERDSQHQEQADLLSEKTSRLADLETRLKETTESKNTLEQTLCEQFDTINLKWKTEIDAYKEEITQHAITISSLNDRLVKLDKENKDLINQATKLRSERKKMESKKVNASEESNPVLANEINNHHSVVANLERCISALRHENVFLKNKNQEHEDTMKGLNMDLAGTEARLSDLKGELSESQKNEIDRLKIDIQKLEEESNDIRLQLSKMSGIIDSLNQELDDKKHENKHLSQQISEERLNVQDRENKIQDVEAYMNIEKENWLRNINKIEQEGRIATELATIGSQCRGDRHLQIIDAQKMALTELRQKMRTIEMTRLPNSDVPEITHNMLQLKKELAELRAKQALKESAPRGMSSLNEILPRKSITRKPQLTLTEPDKELIIDEKKALISADMHEKTKVLKQLKFDLNVSKAALFDMQQSFEISEACYLQLLKQLLEALDVDDAKGGRTLDNLSFEAKENLKMDREESCGMIIQKIKIMKEMIQRKDELLQSYEKDLVKLKQAEDLTTKTKAQLEQIVQQSRSKGEEVDLLRETLNRTKDMLNQEKRVNNAIKHNKHYVPEKSSSQSRPSSESPKYHCPPEDIMGKAQQVEKKKTEKIKRKDYEIKSLKSELYSKEKELSQATNRLYTLETTMGIKSEEPVS